MAFAASHQHVQKCQKAKTAADQACTQARNGAEAAGQGHNAGGTAQDAGHGGNSDRGSGNLCPRLQNQKQNLDKAKGTCEAELAKCKQTCGDEKTKDDQHNQTWMQTQQKQEHKAEGVKPEICDQQLPGMISKLGEAAAPLAQQAQQACKSGEQSKGGAPQIPPITPPPKEEKKDEQQAQKEALKCESNEGARYSDCNGYYTANCTSTNMSGANCNEFAQRYCGSASGGGQANANIGGATGAVVVDKGGEGLGSPFCSMYQAYKFCQAGARGGCPSCRGTASFSSPTCQNDPSKCMSSEQLVDAQNKCPTDPIFLNPNVQKQIADAKNPEKIAEGTSTSKTPGAIPPSAAGGASSGGGSSGLGGSGGTGAGGGIEGATPESLPVGTAVQMELGNGGGGSGGSGEYNFGDEEEAGRGPAGLTEQSVMPAGAVQGLAKDISNQFGPNVFSISSTVYRSMCSKGTLTACKRGK
jgi:hypothetical protein